MRRSYFKQVIVKFQEKFAYSKKKKWGKTHLNYLGVVEQMGLLG